MLFQDITTEQERAQGFIDAAVLFNRIVESSAYRFGSQGGGIVVLSLAIGDAYYELEVWYDPQEPEYCGFFWNEGETENGILYGSQGADVGDSIPLTIPAAITSLCTTFGLDSESVVKNAVNLHAFWEAGGEYLRLPSADQSGQFRLCA